LGEFLAGRSDLSPKAWPRHVWITDGLPSTATNKILKRELSARGAAPEDGLLWTRIGRDKTYVVVDRSAKAAPKHHVSPT
jgi:fatty-acyl-CoA synthase